MEFYIYGEYGFGQDRVLPTKHSVKSILAHPKDFQWT